MNAKAALHTCSEVPLLLIHMFCRLQTPASPATSIGLEHECPSGVPVGVWML